jgi:hypothetical protein
MAATILKEEINPDRDFNEGAVLEDWLAGVIYSKSFCVYQHRPAFSRLPCTAFVY